MGDGLPYCFRTSQSSFYNSRTMRPLHSSYSKNLHSWYLSSLVKHGYTDWKRARRWYALHRKALPGLPKTSYVRVPDMAKLADYLATLGQHDFDQFVTWMPAGSSRRGKFGPPIARPPVPLDLTTMGIEPNPGPKQGKAKTKRNVSSATQKKTKPMQKQNMAGDIAEVVGKQVAGPVGGYLFKKAGDWFGKLVGMGGYKVQRNTVLTNGPAIFSDRSFTTSHRECLGDIVGSTAFTIRSYPLNPGQAATFPWGSQMACCYQQYELLGCVFEFVSTSATAVSSTNTALGSVVMATNYDPVQPAFTDKISMEATEFCTSGVPSTSFMHPIECAPKKTGQEVKLLRTTTGVISGATLQEYDHGNFFLATAGMQAAATIGELWVTYHVRYLKPILNKTNIQSGHAQGTFLANNPVTPDLTTVAGSSVTITRFNATDFTVSGVTPNKQYQITYFAKGTGLVGTPSLGIVSGGSRLTYWNNDGTNQAFASYTTDWLVTAIFFSTSTTMQLTLGAMTAGTGNVDVFVTSLDATVLKVLPPLEVRFNQLLKQLGKPQLLTINEEKEYTLVG